jgi:uncharacterized pyridoxamine 5'-phosphate oxidase family protein
MNQTVNYLSKCKTFFLATADGDQPCVRPFGAVIEFQGKPYLCTNNQKQVFEQILKNPKVQICGLLEDGSWLRVTARAFAVSSREARVAMLEATPGLKNMYQPDDGLFEVLALEDVITELAAFGGNGYTMKRI